MRYCLSPVQDLTTKPAMYSWPWSSSLLTSLKGFTLTVMRKTLEQETRSVVHILGIYKFLVFGVQGEYFFKLSLLLQGLMFGYATDETEECMPLTIILAHKLNAKMSELRRKGILPWLRPDSKTQVELCLI